MQWPGDQDKKYWPWRGLCPLPTSTPRPVHGCSHSPRLMDLLEAKMRTLSLLEAPHDLPPLPGDVVSWLPVLLTFPSTRLRALINKQC